MFGLLKHRKLIPESYNEFRLNQCGTCKTIGRLYGHKERFLLNYDVVFLSELLAALSSNKEDFKDIKPNVCLTLPKQIEKIPSFLKYTASVNVLLSNYKITDNSIDAKSKLNVWRLIKKLGDKNFKKAITYLNQQGLNTKYIDEIIKEQFLIESKACAFDSFERTFKYYSNLTGKVTGEVFECSVKAYKNKSFSGHFYEIGKQYGEIVYLIDALEDFDEDKKNKKFNLFLINNYYNEKNVELINNYINQSLIKIQISINSLPFEVSKKKEFISRIFLNINMRKEAASFDGKNKLMNIREKIHYAIQITEQKIENRKGLYRRISYFSYSFFLILFFILFPHIVKAESSNDNCCTDNGLNPFPWSACKNICCNPCGIILCCSIPCFSGCGSSGGGPKVIIQKIFVPVDVDKGCGCN